MLKYNQSMQLMRTQFRPSMIYLVSSFVTIFLFVQYHRFVQFGEGLHQNIYDYLLYIFNDYFNVFYFLLFVYLVMMYPLSPTSSFNQYVIMRFRSRGQWYRASVTSISMVSISLLLSILVICILQSLITLGFENQWSEYADSVNKNRAEIQPLIVVSGKLLLIFLYTFSMGIIFFTVNLWLKNAIASFLLTYGLNVVTILIYSNHITTFYFLTFVRHVLIRQGYHNFYNHLGVSIGYWLSFIVLFLFIGWLGLRKIDLQWRIK